MKKLALILFLILFACKPITYSQDDEQKKDVKTGLGWGALPVVAYNSDEGFRYGALANLFMYGDGSRYPLYDHSMYIELSWTTKGGAKYQTTYDSDRLIPNIRTTMELSYTTEKALDFYGFNGYNSLYNSDFEDKVHDDYKTQLYYRHQRKLFKIKADFQGKIIEKKLRWLAGFGIYNMKVSTVDRDEYDDDIIEAGEATLYDNYVTWNVIPDNQKDGGNINFIKTGFVYDTRDNEPNPNKGMWTELLLLYAPEFLGSDQEFSRFIFLHRQYFTLIPNALTFAYRVDYQTKISGESPFYMLPFLFDSKQTRDGLGGAKNIRGILRNRIEGEGMAFGNFELRWKVLKTKLLKRNFYIALSTFADIGRVVDPFAIDLSNVPNDDLANFNFEEESLHTSIGGGIRFALNENFIVAIDYGVALNKYDGSSGLYIGLNWLF